MLIRRNPTPLLSLPQIALWNLGPMARTHHCPGYKSGEDFKCPNGSEALLFNDESCRQMLAIIKPRIIIPIEENSKGLVALIIK